MLVHRLCSLSGLLLRPRLAHGPLLRANLTGRALHTCHSSQHIAPSRRQLKDVRRAPRLVKCISGAAAVATEPSAAAAPASENVIQLLRARGLIQVELLSNFMRTMHLLDKHSIRLKADGALSVLQH